FASRGPEATVRALFGLVAFAALLWALGPVLRAVYPPHDVKVSNPAEHARRLTLLGAVLIAALRVELDRPRWVMTRPLRILDVFGRHSLVAYVFHEALLYFPGASFTFFALWGRRSDAWTWAGVTSLLIVATYGACIAVERLSLGSAGQRRVDREILAALWR